MGPARTPMNLLSSEKGLQNNGFIYFFTVWMMMLESLTRPRQLILRKNMWGKSFVRGSCVHLGQCCKGCAMGEVWKDNSRLPVDKWMTSPDRTNSPCRCSALSIQTHAYPWLPLSLSQSLPLCTAHTNTHTHPHIVYVGYGLHVCVFVCVQITNVFNTSSCISHWRLTFAHFSV